MPKTLNIVVSDPRLKFPTLQTQNSWFQILFCLLKFFKKDSCNVYQDSPMVFLVVAILTLRFPKFWTHKNRLQILFDILKFFKNNSPNTSRGFPRALVKCPNNCHLKFVTTNFKVWTHKVLNINLVFPNPSNIDFILLCKVLIFVPMFQKPTFWSFDFK